MKQPESVMSKRSKEEFLEWCRSRYPKRDRKGKSRMLDEICETLGWDRKHAIKALNGLVSLGRQAKKRGRQPKYEPLVTEVVVAIWRLSEYPCSLHLKALLPHWLPFWEEDHGKLEKPLREQVLGVSIRQLDRLTAPYRLESAGRGRRTGRRSHRLKEQVPVRCGPWEVAEPGWMEADTVSHGGGSSRGDFAHTLTLTDIHSGWTVLHGIWCLSAGGVVRGLDLVEEDLPFALKGFDSDNGSEFLNEVLEAWLTGRKVHWTRSRPYKKNDQAHVEQKNFTHVRQLLGYGRIGEIEQVEAMNRLYREAWMPLRNHFIPVMKLVEKTRVEGRWKKRYDQAATPYERLMKSGKLSPEQCGALKEEHKRLNPLHLAEAIERGLREVFGEQAVEELDPAVLKDGEPPAASRPAAAPAPVATLPAPTLLPDESGHSSLFRLVS
jgi:hypothetical protein